MIDRLQKAQKSDFDDQVFEQARKLIASHHAKFAREGWQIPGLPDDQITAQFLSIAEWPRLSNMLYDLMSERKQSSHSWAWYVTVALQRIHGISPNQVRDIRAKLRMTGYMAWAPRLQWQRPAPFEFRPIRIKSRPCTTEGGQARNSITFTTKCACSP